MAELIGIYTGVGLNAPATNLIRIPTVAGTITGVYVDLSDVADGDTEFEVTLDGVLVTGATIADGTEDESVTGLSTAMSLGSVIALNLVSPFPTSLPAPPITLIVTYTTATDIPYSHASASSAAYLDFKEDTDNGTNRVRLIGPASTADVTVTLPASTGTVALVDDTAYDATSWNGVTDTAPSKNAVRDAIEALSVGGGDITTDTAWAAKGDLIAATGNDAAAVVSVGTDGQFLKADSAAPSGVSWDSIPGGGDMLSTNNLSDVANAATALTNLGLTATASEINVLDGVTASTAELNILDGVTATASELNALDGITATVTELNYTDGVTSAIQTQLDAKAPATPSVNAQTGTTYTLLSSDNGKIVTLSNASAITLTVPSGLGAGFHCQLVQLGAGQVTLSASSTTIRNRQSHTKLAGQYAAASLTSHVSNDFIFAGDTAA